MQAGAELVAQARLICGEQHVIAGSTVLSTYRSDGIRRDGPLPLAAVLPGSAAEVAGIVAACAMRGIPFIARGAGTSRAGAALPVADGLLVVLTRMRRILSRTDDEITVQAGAPAGALPAPAAGAWFPGNQPIGTVGGHVAQTAGITNVTALELVRPDGVAVALEERTPGYDVTGAFPGSCGHAGIAVTITLRAVREP